VSSCPSDELSADHSLVSTQQDRCVKVVAQCTSIKISIVIQLEIARCCGYDIGNPSVGAEMAVGADPSIMMLAGCFRICPPLLGDHTPPILSSKSSHHSNR
jgi:hypothetical protein